MAFRGRARPTFRLRNRRWTGRGSTTDLVLSRHVRLVRPKRVSEVTRGAARRGVPPMSLGVFSWTAKTFNRFFEWWTSQDTRGKDANRSNFSCETVVAVKLPRFERAKSVRRLAAFSFCISQKRRSFFFHPRFPVPKLKSAPVQRARCRGSPRGLCFRGHARVPAAGLPCSRSCGPFSSCFWDGRLSCGGTGRNTAW